MSGKYIVSSVGTIYVRRVCYPPINAIYKTCETCRPARALVFGGILYPGLAPGATTMPSLRDSGQDIEFSPRRQDAKDILRLGLSELFRFVFFVDIPVVFQ